LGPSIPDQVFFETVNRKIWRPFSEPARPEAIEPGPWEQWEWKEETQGACSQREESGSCAVTIGWEGEQWCQSWRSQVRRRQWLAGPSMCISRCQSLSSWEWLISSKEGQESIKMITDKSEADKMTLAYILCPTKLFFFFFFWCYWVNPGPLYMWYHWVTPHTSVNTCSPPPRIVFNSIFMYNMSNLLGLYCVTVYKTLSLLYNHCYIPIPI
jgi:hypothetical protein